MVRIPYVDGLAQNVTKFLLPLAAECQLRRLQNENLCMYFDPSIFHFQDFQSVSELKMTSDLGKSICQECVLTIKIQNIAVYIFLFFTVFLYVCFGLLPFSLGIKNTENNFFTSSTNLTSKLQDNITNNSNIPNTGKINKCNLFDVYRYIPSRPEKPAEDYR